jgi:hypothetical protein
MSDRAAGNGENHVDFRIAGQHIRVRAGRRERRLLRSTARRLQKFAGTSSGGVFELWLSFYSQDRVFEWPGPRLDAFRRVAEKTCGRYPRDTDEAEKVRESLRLFRHIGPDTECGRLLGSWLDRPQSLMHVRSHFNQCFIDAGSARGCCFIHRNSRRTLRERLAAWRGRNGGQISAAINAVMAALSCLLVRQGGLLLHGAAVQKGERALVFLGVSEAGKSTAARLCGADVCYSDDAIILKNALYLLEKSDRFEILPMRKTEMMRIVLLNLIHFFRYFDDKTAAKAFDVVRDMVHSLPVNVLRFEKEHDKWDIVW